MKTKLLLLLALLCLCGCSLLSSPTAAAKKFIASAEEGDVDSMTSLFSSKAKEHLGLELIRSNSKTFAEMVGTTIKNGGKLKVGKVDEIVDNYNARVSLVYQDQDPNNSIGLAFDLSKENGTWKIDDVRYLDVRPENTGPAGGPAAAGSPTQQVEPPPPPVSSQSPSSKASPASPPAVRPAISAGVLNGKAISLPKPPYPPIARAAKASGTVVVQVLVDENGNVVSANAVSGHPLLRAASVAAARSAKFSPTKLSGQPVKISGVISYKFEPLQ